MRSAVYPERSRRGYTLIELLVVISIIAILAVLGFVNFKNFATDQITVKAQGQVQTLLRLAQSNATSSTLCNGQGGVPWSLIFNNATSINLACGSANSVQKTYTLENVQVAITGDSNCSIGFPATISYSSRIGTQSLSSSGATNACLQSSAITFTVSNIRNPNASPRLFKVSKGGAIDVE